MGVGVSLTCSLRQESKNRMGLKASESVQKGMSVQIAEM
jgi:hypothetical protein